MKKRVLTGIAMFAILTLFVCLRFVHHLFFDALVMIVLLASTSEIISAYKLNNKKSYSALLYMFDVSVFLCYQFSGSILRAWALQFICILIMFVICFSIELFSHKEENSKVLYGQESFSDLKDNSGLIEPTLLTIRICLYPTLLIGTLFGVNRLGLWLGFVALLLVFGVACFSDMFAYFFGMLFGRKSGATKLCPHISPKKSVVGFVFGCVGGLLTSTIGILLFYFFPVVDTHITTLSPVVAVAMFFVIGALGTLVSQFGDLFSSAIKRKVGIKDFGAIFPGHGGFMDRMDSVMFVSCLVYLCFSIIV